MKLERHYSLKQESLGYLWALCAWKYGIISFNYADVSSVVWFLMKLSVLWCEPMFKSCYMQVQYSWKTLNCILIIHSNSHSLYWNAMSSHFCNYPGPQSPYFRNRGAMQRISFDSGFAWSFSFLQATTVSDLIVHTSKCYLIPYFSKRWGTYLSCSEMMRKVTPSLSF